MASGSTSGGVGPRPSHQMHPSGRSTQRTSRASTTTPRCWAPPTARASAGSRARAPPAPPTSARASGSPCAPTRSDSSFRHRALSCRSVRRFTQERSCPHPSSSSSKGSTARARRRSSIGWRATSRRRGRRVHADARAEPGPGRPSAARDPAGRPPAARRRARRRPGHGAAVRRRPPRPPDAARSSRRSPRAPTSSPTATCCRRSPTRPRRRTATGSPGLARDLRVADLDAAARRAGRGRRGPPSRRRPPRRALRRRRGPVPRRRPLSRALRRRPARRRPRRQRRRSTPSPPPSPPRPSTASL